MTKWLDCGQTKAQGSNPICCCKGEAVLFPFPRSILVFTTTFKTFSFTHCSTDLISEKSGQNMHSERSDEASKNYFSFIGQSTPSCPTNNQYSISGKHRKKISVPNSLHMSNGAPGIRCCIKPMNCIQQSFV